MSRKVLFGIQLWYVNHNFLFIGEMQKQSISQHVDKHAQVRAATEQYLDVLREYLLFVLMLLLFHLKLVYYIKDDSNILIP